MGDKRWRGEGANQKRSPQFHPWQDENRVASEVDVEACLRRRAVVSSAVSGYSFFPDNVGRRGIGGSTHVGLDWLGDAIDIKGRRALSYSKPEGRGTLVNVSVVMKVTSLFVSFQHRHLRLALRLLHRHPTHHR